MSLAISYFLFFFEIDSLSPNIIIKFDKNGNFVFFVHFLSVTNLTYFILRNNRFHENNLHIEVVIIELFFLLIERINKFFFKIY